MAHAHYVTCDTTIDGKPIKGLKVEVITNFKTKPTTLDVQKALQALHPGKKIGGIFGLKA